MSTDEDDLEDNATTEIEEPLDKFVQHRIFLNQVDQFHAKHISDYITDKIFGSAKAEEIGEGGEGEEEEDEVKVKNKPLAVAFGPKYEVVGTMKYKCGEVTENILHTINEQDTDLFLDEIMTCGVIVYDISVDPNEIPKALATLSAIEAEIDKVRDIGPKTFKRFSVTRVFILISTIMTWGNTKPIDPDDPDVPFTEADYRKRKPHPNFLDYINCEREVVLKGRKYKDKLKTYVICSGITYGFEENDLFFFFKKAWDNDPYLPCFHPGINMIPFIHVQDLAKVLHALIETLPKKPQYILAVEQTPCKMKQVVKALAKEMGSRKVKDVTKEEAFLFNNITQTIFDKFTVNLNMEPAYIVDDLGIEFRNDLNIAENMRKIIGEFRAARYLFPKRILLHGPPAVGKSLLAAKLCELYGVHYVSVKTMIEEILEDLRGKVDDEILKQKNKVEEIEVDEEEMVEGEEEEDESMDELLGKIRDIETTMQNADNGKLPEDYVIRLMKSFLAQNKFQNQGYVLDGFPKTISQAKELFGLDTEMGEEMGEEEEDEEGGAFKVPILPTNIISLDADDDFLCKRVMELPEKDVQNTHYTEEHMLRRLKEFRSNNTEDNTLLNFFDEIEVHPVIINAMEDVSEEMVTIFEKVMESVGKPVGFMLSPEDQEQLLICKLERLKLMEENARIEKEIFEQHALEDYQYKMEEKIRILTELQMEEEKLLAAKCEPIRNYLMKYVFPTLTTALLEVAKVKPEDPVDYLAEYLFKMNPEGRMFDPSYNRQGELLETLMKDVRD